METPQDTGLKDKTGRTIYVGDVLLHRLGKFSKSGGTTTLKVIQFGKKYHVVDASETDYKYGGRLLTPDACKNLVVIQSSHITG